MPYGYYAQSMLGCFTRYIQFDFHETHLHFFFCKIQCFESAATYTSSWNLFKKEKKFYDGDLTDSNGYLFTVVLGMCWVEKLLLKSFCEIYSMHSIEKVLNTPNTNRSEKEKEKEKKKQLYRIYLIKSMNE